MGIRSEIDISGAHDPSARHCRPSPGVSDLPIRNPLKTLLRLHCMFFLTALAHLDCRQDKPIMLHILTQLPQRHYKLQTAILDALQLWIQRNRANGSQNQICSHTAGCEVHGDRIPLLISYSFMRSNVHSTHSATFREIRGQLYSGSCIQKRDSITC